MAAIYTHTNLIITVILLTANYVKSKQHPSVSLTSSETRTINCTTPHVVMSPLPANFTWIIEANSAYHIDISLTKVDLKDNCGTLFIGPGKNPNSGVGVWLTKETLNKQPQVRVAQPLAFIHMQKFTTGGSLEFEVKCWIFKIPAEILIPIPTRYKPLENDITVDACLKHLDNPTLQKFLLGNSTLQKLFQDTVSNKSLERLSFDDKCWQSDEDNVESHVIWPLFIERNDITSDNPLFTICFKVTVKISSSRNCTFQKSELENIIKTIGSFVDNNGQIEAILVDKRKDFFLLVIMGFLILLLTTVLFSIVWYKQRQSFYKNKAKRKFAELEVNVWPPISINPIHGLEIGEDNNAFDTDNEESSVFTNNWIEVAKKNTNSVENTPSTTVEQVQIEVSDFSSALMYTGKLTEEIPKTILNTPTMERKDNNLVQFNAIVEQIVFDDNDDDFETNL